VNTSTHLGERYEHILTELLRISPWHDAILPAEHNPAYQESSKPGSIPIRPDWESVGFGAGAGLSVFGVGLVAEA